MKWKSAKWIGLTALFFIVFGFIYNTNDYIYYGLICAVYFSIFFIWGVFDINRSYFLESETVKDRGLILTFDDGPDPNITPQVLRILKKYDVKATFFVIGKKAREHPEILKQIHEDGHLIGNHSYSHNTEWTFMSTPKIIEELQKTENEIEKAIGNSHKLFRPPFGVTNPHIAIGVGKMELDTLGWNIRSIDTKAKNATELLTKMKQKVSKKSGIVLLHDNLDLMPEFLEQFLQYCKEKNISFGYLEN